MTSASTRTLTQALYCHHTAPFCWGCWPQLRPGHGPRVCSVTTQHHYVKIDDLSFGQDIATGFLVSPHSTSVSRLLTSALTRTWLQTLQCHHTVPLWLAGDLSFNQDMAQGFVVAPLCLGYWSQFQPGHGPMLSMFTKHYQFIEACDLSFYQDMVPAFLWSPTTIFFIEASDLSFNQDMVPGYLRWWYWPLFQPRYCSRLKTHQRTY